MLLEQAHEWLGWPQPQDILEPSGAGPKVYQEFAKRKIEATLKREDSQLAVRIGILAADPNSADSTAPLAVVCDFQHGASDRILAEAHRLAWSFSRTALLVTLEPHRLIAWSCYVDPNQLAEQRKICELPTPNGLSVGGSQQQNRVRDLLHWVSLITGHFQRQCPKQFRSDGRADKLLLKNLRHVRGKLLNEMGLGRDYCHDLLARIIFTQFLFHRQDSDGNPFFSHELLNRLYGSTLSKRHEHLSSILRDKVDTYSLFRWLDNHFNGDLFPGKADSTHEERENAWQAERDAVRVDHLNLLADLVSGTMVTSDRQLLLWPQYSFDVIPLEFISSIYEEFLSEDKYKNKAFYTPPHLVDYVLDAVLPWGSKEWNLRLLDPSCGSGIFLVKAFQRLIDRWRRANGGRDPLVSDLKPILANNLVGVDINPDAVRVASFSLYLAMADAIEPKHYITNEKVFPRLRDKQIVANDFFDETTPGYRTKEDADVYDYVIGNAPWGEKSIIKTSDISPANLLNVKSHKIKTLTKAELWAKSNHWPRVNNDIGPLFIAKSLALVNDGGRVAMVQPAPAWLYSRSGPAVELRKRLFKNFTVEEITNLAAVRRELFEGAIGPACIIVAGRTIPSPESTLFYYAPKPSKTGRSARGIIIDAHDTSQILQTEAAEDPLVWSVLALGGRRDLNLIRRFDQFPSLAKLEAEQRIQTRMGVIPGDKAKELPIEFRERKYLDTPRFPRGTFLELVANSVPKWNNPRIHSRDSINFEAFKLPQLIIKQSYSAKTGRFCAAIVQSNEPEWGIICKETYVSVRDLSPDAGNIQRACLMYNSVLAVYYLALTSSRLAHYITEIPTGELLTVPLPQADVSLQAIDSPKKIDEEMRNAFQVTQADWANIEDLIEFTLPDCLRKLPGPGRQPTKRKGNESDIAAYSRTISYVIKNTFGKDKNISATVYQEPAGQRLPVRMITLHFDWPERKALTIELIAADQLFELLNSFARATLKSSRHLDGGDRLAFQRVAYLFHSDQTSQGRVRSLTIIKPDERRYWTRSIAMRDADDLAAAILKAAGGKGGP